MRIMLLLVFACPLLAAAQINRSATELAKETTADYIRLKAFKKQVYHPVSYGDLVDLNPTDKQSNLIWAIRHRFEIEETRMVDDKKVVVRQPYTFYFYLDERMRVVKAESYYVE